MASPRTKLLLLAVGIGGIVAVLVVARALIAPEDPGGVVEVSGTMPVLEGETLTGETLDVADYRGKVVLVNFWAAWCGPCRLEQPALERLSREYGERVQFIGVNHLDHRASALEYLREFDVTYPSIESPDGRIAHEFGIPYIPNTVLVDPAGEMRYLLLGEQTEETFRNYLDVLLAAGAQGVR